MSDLADYLAGVGNGYADVPADVRLACREAAITITRLRTALATANEELATWKSVFPDIAPSSVVPSTATMLREVGNAALERAALAGYLACAETRHVTLGDKVRATILALKQETNNAE